MDGKTQILAFAFTGITLSVRVANTPTVLLSRTRSQAFLVKSEHQPWGLISPSTILQAFGAWKLLHRSQRCAPFGCAWYETVF